MLNYYGTDLNSAGHYFWELQKDSIYNGRFTFSDFPFNPEGLPYKEKGKSFINGHAEFYKFCGFSIYAIEGSCSDGRPGSKSIFFIKVELDKDEMKNFILSVPIAKKIIDKMPFKIKW